MMCSLIHWNPPELASCERQKCKNTPYSTIEIVLGAYFVDLWYANHIKINISTSTQDTTLARNIVRGDFWA